MRSLTELTRRDVATSDNFANNVNSCWSLDVLFAEHITANCFFPSSYYHYQMFSPPCHLQGAQSSKMHFQHHVNSPLHRILVHCTQHLQLWIKCAHRWTLSLRPPSFFLFVFFLPALKETNQVLCCVLN